MFYKQRALMTCLTHVTAALTDQQTACNIGRPYVTVLDVTTAGDNLFYPAWAFAVPTMVLSIPQAVFESGIWSIIVYWVRYQTTVAAVVCNQTLSGCIAVTWAQSG